MTRISSWFVGGIVLTCACAGSAEIQHVTTRLLSISERGEIQAWVARTETNSFSFIPPAEWSMKCFAQENVMQMTSADQTSKITIRLNQPRLESTNELAWRTNLLSRFQQPALLHEFICYTGESSGRAYDLEEKTGRGAVRWHRVAVIPFLDSTVEIRLTTSIALSNNIAALDTVLGSFRRDSLRRNP